ncbi:e3 ubiquitin-protein ligase pub24 [Quercus suber]|uniref:E3 ubiquitin-protein ligase pub24 n=1 Tax=Quercus suber TaxID=58331 RepID=A0AAW0KKD7_QUESU
MIEANTVFELIELELSFPEKKTTELILGILCNLGSIAVVSMKILGVSPKADDRAQVKSSGYIFRGGRILLALINFKVSESNLGNEKRERERERERRGICIAVLASYLGQAAKHNRPFL